MKYLMLVVVGSACLSASTVYDTSAPFTGTRSVGASGGLVDGGGSAYNGLMLNWSIVELADLTYDYTYTLTGFASPQISHFILELSDNCVNPSTPGGTLPTCVSNAKVDGAAATTVLGDWCYGSKNCQGSSNLGLPGPIDGIKFTSLPSGSVTITFNSPRAPVYGDFYLIGGQQYVYNIGNANHLDTNPLDFIARPDTIGGDPATPEPATLGLVGAALTALGLMRRKAKRSSRHVQRGG